MSSNISAHPTAVTMSHTDQNNESPPFQFLGLPKEIQTKIIETTLTIEREAFRPHGLQPTLANTPDTLPRIHDFNINAFGMRSHTLPPFGLLFVNKEVSGDALAIVYQNSSFAIHAEISRDGVPSLAFGYIPEVVKRISPMIKENAREVTFKISTINEGCNFPHDKHATLNRGIVLRRALGDLRVLLNEATFPHVKTLNLVLNTQGLVQSHLNIILKLFAATGCVITLEEICNTQPATSRKAFGEMVALAARAWGQTWLLTEKPTEQSSGEGTWHGYHNVSWGRRRKWERLFVKPGPKLKPFNPLRN
ncbi:hypothetical protein N431DRAFT_558980 [Stipitochalara longipes BDJ]|nr:hypothetical protein N431DRAFT_558980 [Stipitochalara longipes BDJ]